MLPGPTDADVVAIGGVPTPERVMAHYPHGVFPWPHDDMPLLWFSPDPRFVVPLGEAHLPRSLKKTMRKTPYRITADQAFTEVMRGCQRAERVGQRGTWITDQMVDCYTELHRRGVGHSAEAWLDGELVGGLYGLAFGDVFFGESMFATRPDASKVAFGTLLAQLTLWGYHTVDCQTYTDHLERFGARDIPRETFLAALADNRRRPERFGTWQMTIDSRAAVEILKNVS